MSPGVDPRIVKRVLRPRLGARRAALAPAAARAAAARVAEQVLALPEVVAASGVMACLSFGDELDTRGLIERLLAGGREVYVPRAEPGERRLHLHRFPCALERLSFGLEQPLRGAAELPAAEIDATIGAVLVAGLGFDRSGYRLGYGGGYFDRFLAGRSLPAIGLAYDVQLVDALPREPHDVPMTAVVTESGVLRPPAPLGSA